MLFNAPGFIFVYLPIVLFGFFALARFAPAYVAAAWLAAASLAFYAYDDPRRLLPLILVSITFNYIAGRRLSQRRERGVLVFSVAANLALLGYFKYTGFLLSSLAELGLGVPLVEVALPIGISFYTFTQIAFLVDSYRGEASEYRPVHYVLFVTFFPHLIAGPILHHKEMIPQFDDARTYRVQPDSIAAGVTWFAAGLFKKVMLADNIAIYADAMFRTVESGQGVGVLDAWLGVLAYSLQIYFDFSGYSDMAIGLALLFGIRFPLNFYSPYQATSLSDFWRRWHITLSRFLRDYVYIPLGGNRRGRARRYLNLLATMLLGGLWHGASWNFVLWGAIHGVGLAVNSLWRDWAGGRSLRLPLPAGRLLTLLTVVFAWVPFRAADLDDTLAIWATMLAVPGELGPIAFGPGWVWVAALGAIALFAPNTKQILEEAGTATWLLQARRNPAWALVFGLALGTAVASSLVQPSAFLYFRF